MSVSNEKKCNIFKIEHGLIIYYFSLSLSLS